VTFHIEMFIYIYIYILSMYSNDYSIFFTKKKRFEIERVRVTRSSEMTGKIPNFDFFSDGAPNFRILPNRDSFPNFTFYFAIYSDEHITAVDLYRIISDLIKKI